MIEKKFLNLVLTQELFLYFPLCFPFRDFFPYPRLEMKRSMRFALSGFIFEKLEREDKTALFDYLALVIIDRKAHSYSHRCENGMNIISLKM